MSFGILSSIILIAYCRAMSIIYSHYNLFENIYVNTTTDSGASSCEFIPFHVWLCKRLIAFLSANTDGADTIYSSFIHFNKWIVDNGDDSISLKANSTDITITNSTFYRGLGIAIGSIGQYKDTFETIERLTVDNIRYEKTLHVVSLGIINPKTPFMIADKNLRYISRRGLGSRLDIPPMVVEVV